MFLNNYVVLHNQCWLLNSYPLFWKLFNSQLDVIVKPLPGDLLWSHKFTANSHFPCFNSIYSLCHLFWLLVISRFEAYFFFNLFVFSVQFSSVAQPCLTLCYPMNGTRPGLPVHHQLPKSTQTHVHCVDDAIQPSHPLLSPSPPALNLSQHQGLFHWVSSLHQMANIKVLSK